MKLRIAIVFLLWMITGCAVTREGPQTERPNIVLILTDDQPYDSLQYMPIVQTELAQKGIVFENAYVTTPLCCPSRASIFTGLYAHNHNVKTNRMPVGGATVFDDSSTLALWLSQAGYQTALMGKYLNDYDALPEGYIPPGWSEWDAFVSKDPNRNFYFNYTLNENGTIKQYGLDQEDYSTDVLCEKAVDFIHSNSDKPFFMMVSLYSPHLPYMAADRHTDLFKQYNEYFSPYRPPNYYEADLSDKPKWLSSAIPPEKETVDGVYQRMLRSLAAVDDGVERIVTALDEEGIRNNTMVIFMSDNGYALGDHALLGKACPYDECLHVPMVISYPDQIKQQQVNSDFVLNIDLAPTIMELVGKPNASIYDGQSFLSLLNNEGSFDRDGFLFEQYQDDGEEKSRTSLVPAYVGFRTTEWKYIEYETGERELYNLMDDPYEMENLASKPQYETLMQELLTRIHEIRP